MVLPSLERLLALLSSFGWHAWLSLRLRLEDTDEDGAGDGEDTVSRNRTNYDRRRLITNRISANNLILLYSSNDCRKINRILPDHKIKMKALAFDI
jgi:hypothetical protein